MQKLLKNNSLAFLLFLPIILIYSAHFFYHTGDKTPSGFLQWENAIYLLSAKEYKTGNATILYQYPLADSPDSPKVFFQPQTFVLGYLWKWTNINPGILISLFGLFFGFLTIKSVLKLFERIVPDKRYTLLLTSLFLWGGGVLSLAGCFLHFTYFKSSGNLVDHLFFLDPGNGWWCLNFGRALVYPFESYYHFLFILAINQLIQKRIISVVLIMILLTLSHPYTSAELILIITTWASIEFFYIKSDVISKKHFYLLFSGLLFFIIFYGIFLQQIPVYKEVSKHVALDWSYKIWHFLPAYFLVWLSSWWAVRTVPLLKSHFQSPLNRLFFTWGIVAFLLSVHGFAIKPVQPLHFTRGYVYAGFFLFSITALAGLFNHLLLRKKIIFATLLILALSDNATWFFASISFNKTGIYYSEEEEKLFSQLNNVSKKSWIIASDKNEPLSAYIQLYTPGKAWIPHPFLTFEKEKKIKDVDSLLQKNKISSDWLLRPSYFVEIKTNIKNHNLMEKFPVVFENEKYRIFEIH